MQELKKIYTDFLKDGQYLLLKSSDEYFLLHYLGSPLNILTGFSGSAGEALIDKAGKITLFVDPRYHEQADFETKNIDIVKLKLGDSFSKSIAKKVKDSVLYISESTSYGFCEKLEDEGVQLELYKDFKGFGQNQNLDETKEIFTLNANSFLNKTKKLKSEAKSRFYYVSSLDEIAYLTDLRSYKMPNTSTFPSKMLLDFEGNYTLYCDYQIKKLPLGLKQKRISDFKTDISQIKDEVAISANNISMGDFVLINTPVEFSENPIANLASIKEEAEISHLKSAFERLDCALYNFKKQIKAGLSELELKEIFEQELILAGAKTTSFKTILAVGENSSSIHYSNYDKNKILKEGDLILLDCGGYYEQGLATDITRVFLCGNKASFVQKEIYTAVLKAFLNAYHSNADSGEKLDKIARKILSPYEKDGFLFPHALGHGIGIPVHQCPPVISSHAGKKFPLYVNMTHTIEPGLYCENCEHKFGVRLENSVFVTGQGTRESFSKFEFEENLIEYDMLNEEELKWLNQWQKRWRRFCEGNFSK